MPSKKVIGKEKFNVPHEGVLHLSWEMIEKFSLANLKRGDRATVFYARGKSRFKAFRGKYVVHEPDCGCCPVEHFLVKPVKDEPCPQTR